ncbi:MAG: hypothetical protein QOC99_2711 [Acidobacteriota bacterium]|nr:hypothetical protein [Acidobacteriota bacterium]
MAEDETSAQQSEGAEESGVTLAGGTGGPLPAPPPEVTVPPDDAGQVAEAEAVAAPEAAPEAAPAPETAPGSVPPPELENAAASQPEPATSAVADAVSDDAAPAVEPTAVSGPGEAVSHYTGSHRLPNGMVGKPYSASVDLREWGFRSSPTLRATFAEQVSRLGLGAEAEAFSLQISGTPVEQGEHELLLHYNLGDDPRTFHKKVSWLINPDPKSLWKAIEPDTSLPYRKEHTAAQRLVGREYQVVAASRRGRSHAHEGKFREDDFAAATTPEGWYILLVADGAGSARFSREGSRLSCETAARTLGELIPKTFDARFDVLLRDYASGSNAAEKEIRKLLYQALCGAAFASYKALEVSAAEAGHALKDYATTLLLGLVRQFEQGTFVSSFWIGDGAIALLDGRGSAQLMGTPDGGEFSGQTRFLTMREVVADGAEMLRRVRFTLTRDFGALILMTDGISDPKFGTDKNLASAEKWEEFWREIDGAVAFKQVNEDAPQRLLEWMDFLAPGEHDDRTVAVLC